MMGDPSIFNAECYLNRYPDLGAILEDHYNNFGLMEGRTAGTDADPYTFNAVAYLHRYPDLGKFLADHFAEHGQAEGRVPGCDISRDPGNGTGGTVDTGSTGTGTNKTLLWVAIAAGVLFFAHKKKLF